MSRDAPNLLEIQHAFHHALLGDEDRSLASFLQTDQDAGPRVAVHRATVQGGLIEALATAFPVTRRVIGGAFTDLARKFILAAPPRLPQLSAYGDGFANFIAGDDITRRAPYLSGVARLEWARAESYFAGDAAPLESARLTKLTPDVLAGLVLQLHPATRLIVSRFPILRIWQVNQPEVVDVPRVDLSESETVLVTRVGHQLVMRALTPGDAAFIAAVMSGETLGEAADAALDAQHNFGLQAALQAHFIGGTFQDELGS